MKKYWFIFIVLILTSLSLSYYFLIEKKYMDTISQENYEFRMEVDQVGYIIGKGNYIYGTVTKGSIKESQSVYFERTKNSFSIDKIYLDSKRKKEVVSGDKPTIFLESESFEELSDGEVTFSP